MAGIDDERLDFSTAGTSPIKEARQAIDDGKHRLADDTHRRLSSILVTPQQPPFKGTIYTVSFERGSDQKLALNKEDYAKLQWLMDGNPEGRAMKLASADEKRVRIYLDEEEG